MFWAELNEFNRHFMDSKVRMDGIGKRLKSLEECNGADDQKDEASSKRKAYAPSKDIRVC